MSNLIIVPLIVVIVFINIIMTVFLFKRIDLEFSQKLLQILIVWLIPFLASIVLHVFYSTQDEKAEPFQREFGGGTSSGIGGSHGGE